MKNTKRIGALLMAVVMVMALSVTAFAAADMNGEKGVIGEFQSADTPDAAYDPTVIIYKEITAFNANTEKINAPTIEYSYSIEAGAAGASVKDAGGKSLHASETAVEVQVKAGPTGATISGSVDKTNYVAGKLQLTPAVELDASSGGAKNAFPIKVDLSNVTWSGAGVYRYKITENCTTDTKNAAGIADGAISDTRYLDVYVKDNAAGTGYEIYGYVCFSNLGAIDGTDADSVTAAAKTEGFVAIDLNGDNDYLDANESADKYYTFDLTVSKTLVGDTAMNGNKFPFNVDFTNDSVTAKIGLKQTTVAGGGITANLPANAAVSSLDVTDLALANGASVTYIGIPVGITAKTEVAVYEKNNVTGTVYKSSYKIDDGTASTPKSISWATENDANKSDVATLNTITANDSANTAHTIAFTNTLELISPTGVALRVAPFVLMLAAGVALLFFVRRRRSEDEA